MKKKVTTIMVVMAMLCMTLMSAFAAEGVLITLPENQVWTVDIPLTRSGACNYVTVSLDSVYPTTGDADHFKKIQARLRNQIGHVVSKDNYVTLEEGKGNVNIDFKDGFGNTNPVYLQFRGNSEKAAKAVVNYNAH